ncbi:MAG TPA: DUF1828 domain-containing protein [Verrucomicrobiae bacterium]|jgi:hypothetical protein
MTFDLPKLKERLCKSLCGEVQVRTTRQGYLQIVTPFTFPDGDTFQLYLEEAAAGSVRLTDFGHTFMHLSYENDLAKFREGTRGKLLDQVLADSGLRDEQGRLVLDSSLDSLGTNVLQFGQALTRIYDLTFLNRSWVASTFYEDLKERLYSLVAPEKIKQDYTLPDHAEADSYPIDFRVEGKRAPLFLFGVATRDKARLVTIILEHWLRAKVEFDSLLIFQDQQVIPRTDLARLSNVGGEMVSSLDATEDFQRKIIKFAQN